MEKDKFYLLKFILFSWKNRIILYLQRLGLTNSFKEINRPMVITLVRVTFRSLGKVILRGLGRRKLRFVLNIRVSFCNLYKKKDPF